VADDQHGNPIADGEGAALAHLDRAVDGLLHFTEAMVTETEAALAENPRLPMAGILQAYLGLLSTQPADAAGSRAFLRTFRAQLDEAALPPRERAHLAAVQTWADGDWSGAGRILRAVSDEHPRDILALTVGHQIDFFTGDSTTLRDRIGAALSAWGPDDPHYANLLGMYAFGLEEAGHYDRSEDVGREAVDRDPKDVWGIHAVVHTYEMQGRFGVGTRYLDARTDDWSSGSFLDVHNWWHYSLYALEAGDRDRALKVYDTVLHTPESDAIALEMLDAAALLWRLYLDGADESARWAALADAWGPLVAEPYYAFNDAHAVMSYVGAGRFADAERLIADRTRWLDGATGSNQLMTARVGLPVCRALVAFGRGRYAEVVDLLYPIRGHVNEYGGSHAQRDAIYKTLIDAALRSGRVPLSRALVSERLALRPCSPYNWLKQAAVLRAAGERGAAAVAEQRAADLVRDAAAG
jgi:tetratricopeptide (TPR) repeat protein